MRAEDVNIDEALRGKYYVKIFKWKKFCTKMLPKILTSEFLKCHKIIYANVLQKLDAGSNLFSKFITGGKTWIFRYDPWTKFIL